MEQLEACRICVTCYPLKDMDFINIFQPSVEFQQELNFIQCEIRHWHLKIDPDDGLPQKMCANCFAKFCSIQAFCSECELGQKKLFENLMLHNMSSDSDVNQPFKNTVLPLPLVANYGTGNISLDSVNNVLVSSVNLTQTDISLNDFNVFDQQFSHFENPSLIDASSTLLDTNLIAAEPTQELGFLPEQNLFTFETAEPLSTGTLPLNETETTSILNNMLVGKPDDDVSIKYDDLEDMLQHSIIPTTTQLTQQTSRLIVSPQASDANVNTTKVDQNIFKKKNPHSNNHAKRFKSEHRNTAISFLNPEDTNSDIEYEETDMNARLKGLSNACHYCFCPETGPIDYLLFPNDDALSQHFFDVHDPNRPYTCPKCSQSFKTKLLRDNHVRLIHNIIEFQTCNYCQKKVAGSTDVHQYNCQYVGDWKCEWCQKKFPNMPLYRFRLHQRQHECTEQFKCRSCKCCFEKKSNLEAHQMMHKTETKCTYTCDICKASFVDDCELKRHKYLQHNDEGRLKCTFCNKGFSSNVYLQRHINQFHLNNTSNNNNNTSSSSSSSSSTSTASSSTEHHRCLNCSMSFNTLDKLQQHLQLGRDNNGQCLSTLSYSKQERRKLSRQGVFPCFHCPKRFHLRSQLDKHLNTHDARLRPIQCAQCVIRCRTPFELKQHVNVAHLNIKAFACEKCGKCFGYKKDLRDHVLFHAEINVHCQEEGCDYACKNEKALSDHIRHKHRLLACEYCSEQFTRQKLTSHLRKMHRGEIDIDLAGESDNFYKSQLLNNNNDITQLSFNLLNDQQEDQNLAKTLLQLPPTSMSSQPVAAAINKAQLQTLITSTSSLSSTLLPTATSLTLTTSPITTIATSSSSSLSVTPLPSSSPFSLSSSLPSNNTKGNHLSSNSMSTHNFLDGAGHDDGQLCAIFASDTQIVNGTTLALKSLVSNDRGLNLVTNDTSNMFLVPSTPTSTNDTHLDQYLMASLIDTEQEITVT